MHPLLAIAIAPVAFLLIYIYEKDVIAKEPKSALIKAFCGGAFLTVIAVLISHAIWTVFFYEAEEWENAFLSAFGQAFLEAALPEEFFKFLILYLFVWKSKDFDENFDGIVYAVFVSMGFACTENILYTFQNGEGTGIMRAFTAVPGHFFFAVIMGYYFSLAKFTNDTRSNLIKSLFFPILAHGVYDMILFLMHGLSEEESDSNTALMCALFLAFFVFNFFLWRQGFRRIKELRNMDIDLLPDDHPQKRNFYLKQGKFGSKRVSLDKPGNPRTRMMSQQLPQNQTNNRFSGNNNPNRFSGNNNPNRFSGNNNPNRFSGNNNPNRFSGNNNPNRFNNGNMQPGSINMGIPTNPMSNGVGFQQGYPQNPNYQPHPSLQQTPINLDQSGLHVPNLHAQSPQQQPRFSENITTPISVKEFNESQQADNTSHTIMTPTPNNRPYYNDNHPENDLTQPNAVNPSLNQGNLSEPHLPPTDGNSEFDINTAYDDSEFNMNATIKDSSDDSEDNSQTVAIPVEELNHFGDHSANNHAPGMELSDPMATLSEVPPIPATDHIDYAELSIDKPLPTINDSPSISNPNHPDLANRSIDQHFFDDIPPLPEPDENWADSPLPTFKELSPITPPPHQSNPFMTPSLVLKDLELKRV